MMSINYYRIISDDMTLTYGMDINEKAATYHLAHSYKAQQQLAPAWVMLFSKVGFSFLIVASTRVFFFSLFLD